MTDEPLDLRSESIRVLLWASSTMRPGTPAYKELTEVASRLGNPNIPFIPSKGIGEAIEELTSIIGSCQWFNSHMRKPGPGMQHLPFGSNIALSIALMDSTRLEKTASNARDQLRLPVLYENVLEALRGSWNTGWELTEDIRKLRLALKCGIEDTAAS
jgi:hypothetical protein